MDSREKLRRALDHQDGPVPLDLGSTATTGIHVSIVAGLRTHYGLEPRPVRVVEPYQMLGEVEEDLRDAIGVDVTGIWPRETIFGFVSEGWREWRTPWGQEVLVSEHFQTIPDGKDTLVYPRGDTEAPPAGRMPETGYFFDTIIRQSPIDESRIVTDNTEEFGPIDTDTLTYIGEAAAQAEGEGRGVIANFGGTGLGDIALVTAPMLTHPRGIRDVEEWYVSTITRRDAVHQIFAIQTEIAIKNLEKIRVTAGDIPDVIFVCGTDFGTQNSTFCSPDAFGDLWLPYYRQINDWVHENTQWRTFKHSCGAVEPLIESLLAAGFDILNPVQCSAAGMDPETLKKKYGDRLVFWGGGVDTQKTLPFGTAAQVRAEVLDRCKAFSTSGGFVFDAIHNVQAKTPIENVVAMIEAVHEFNGGRA